MEWHQIVGFYQVARLGSFTKAAEATFRTQSALSQQIGALEEELDCLLLERIGRRKLRLTPAGEELLKFSEETLEKYHSLVQSLNELKMIQKGSLTIAAPFTTLYHMFPSLLNDYVNRFPHVRLSILDRPQREVLALVKNGDADFGFALESLIPEDLLIVRWTKVETVLITPVGHPLTAKKQVTLRDIAQYPLILPQKILAHSSHLGLDERLRKLGVSFHVVMESSNVELSSLYVEMGLGVSFATVSKGLSALKKRKLEFLSLSHYFEPDYIALVVRKTKRLSSYQIGFINMFSGL